MTDRSERLTVAVDRFTARWRPITRPLGRAASHSRLAAIADRCRTSVDESRLVRWLTSEPDPDVIVIDLAETWTIGPILAVLDRIADALATPVRRSGVWQTTRRVARAVEREAVPAVSGALLGLVIGTLAVTHDGASPLWFAALAIAGIAGLLGLTVDRSRTALAGSVARRWLAALIAPPEVDSRSDRTR